MSSLDIIQDGWDEDEDALEIEELEPPPPPSSYIPSATSMTRSVMKSAYSLGSSTSSAASSAFKTTVAKATSPWPASTMKASNRGGSDDDEEEWAFDDDDLGDDKDGSSLAQAFDDDANKVKPNSKSQMTTEEDLEALRNLPPPPSSCAMYHQLLDYIQSLSEARETLVSAMNAILEAEHNTPEAAMELCRYYEARPNLKEYTLETELPRMSYRLYHPQAPGGGVLEDAGEIARFLKKLTSSPSCPFHQELSIRAANQSLLADLLPPLTGPDRIIRPQFLASAVARRCEFVLDLTKKDKSIVHVTAEMVVGVPYSGGEGGGCGRHGLAVVTVGVHFSPGAILQHSVMDVQSLLQVPQDLPQLEHVALSLERDAQEMNLGGLADDDDGSRSISDSMRDYFLSSSYSSEGWQSAWKQIDSVANVSGKFGFLRSMTMFPTLPTMDDLREAEEEQARWDTNKENHASRGLLDRLAGDSAAAVTPAAPPPLAPPPPPPPPAPAPSSEGASRPAPILGGLLMSGLTRLAKSAALPDVEAEEELYARQEQLDRQRQENRAPTETITLYRTEEEEEEEVPKGGGGGGDDDSRGLFEDANRRAAPPPKSSLTAQKQGDAAAASKKTTSSSRLRAPTKVTKTTTTATTTTNSPSNKTAKPAKKSISSRMTSAARSAMSGVSSSTASLTGSKSKKKSSSFLTSAPTTTTSVAVETEMETVTFGGGGGGDNDNDDIPLALQTHPGDAYQFYLGEKDTADGVVVVMEEQAPTTTTTTTTTSTRKRWYPKGLRFPVY